MGWRRAEAAAVVGFQGLPGTPGCLPGTFSAFQCLPGTPSAFQVRPGAHLTYWVLSIKYRGQLETADTPAWTV